MYDGNESHYANALPVLRDPSNASHDSVRHPAYGCLLFFLSSSLQRQFVPPYLTARRQRLYKQQPLETPSFKNIVCEPKSYYARFLAADRAGLKKQARNTKPDSNHVSVHDHSRITRAISVIYSIWKGGADFCIFSSTNRNRNYKRKRQKKKATKTPPVAKLAERHDDIGRF